MMRIGIDARFFGGEQSKGLGRYTQKLIEYLFKLDQANEYVVFIQREALPYFENVPPNIEVVLAPYHWYSLAEQVLLPIKLYQYKLDFVHFPHFNVPLLYRKPFVVTIHDLIISRFPTERATTLGPIMYKFKQLAYNLVIHHAAKFAQRIITVSNYSKQDIIDFFKIEPNKIDVTYEAVDGFKGRILSEAEVPTLLHRYGITTPYLLYVGNAYPHKNLETLLQVVYQLKKQKRLFFKLVLVGQEDYFYARIQQQAWALDLDKDVVFPGFVPDRDLPHIYQAALAYIFPSKYEGFGLPPLEAMYYNVPVLSSNTSCLPEILGSAALYFDFQDVNGIIKQIFRLQEESELRQQLILAGYQQVQQYSWEHMAKQTLSIYESVFIETQTKSQI
jgi:glycosyltransferase involved in cell wall biosynthesis